MYYRTMNGRRSFNKKKKKKNVCSRLQQVGNEPPIGGATEKGGNKEAARNGNSVGPAGQ